MNELLTVLWEAEKGQGSYLFVVLKSQTPKERINIQVRTVKMMGRNAQWCSAGIQVYNSIWLNYPCAFLLRKLQE